ncbi:hypothetical protein [Candidatus Spongiihabitans sp.]|uniref:hypothetical protein n=1 Tax=Candidatus Spongiihabitans sp. TaxID=3101308 RepID=UPI003C7C7DC8
MEKIARSDFSRAQRVRQNAYQGRYAQSSETFVPRSGTRPPGMAEVPILQEQKSADHGGGRGCRRGRDDGDDANGGGVTPSPPSPPPPSFLRKQESSKTCAALAAPP